MMRQQQQPQALMDINKLMAIEEPDQRRQEIGNVIYPIIQQQYQNAASKITGMLIENEQVVDPVKLVTDINYLQQKAHEAFTLLQESTMGQQQMTPEQMAAAQNQQQQ